MTNNQSVKKYRRLNPWARPREYARRRCTDRKHKDWYCYGGRGIKFNLTMEEVRELYARDHAYQMKIPTLDRKNPDGDYTYKNCRFMELIENVDRRRKRVPYEGQECIVASVDSVKWEE